ncbi:6265_t:CDS:2 [Dentiscutata erythropus]|uniref:6265_t:CDS:1 n=1 Tax=Dentiscutata erythropus TaxID=1348616 RepID=A0A9N9GJU1_9GLOM|nr:6265_t:CDS:2 [Dentiscutata erythropus]
MPSEKKKGLTLPEGLDFTTRPKDSLVDDLRYALEHARELYADIAWEFTLAPTPTTIYAHKAILYARSSRSFQERFLKNKDANGMSIRSVRLSNTDPVTVKTDADPFLFRQELKFFYTAEEGSEDFLQAVDTTDELEQDKLKDDLLYMLKSKLYTDVELTLEFMEDDIEIVDEEEDEGVFKPIVIRAHRFMLSSRSEYFKKMLSSDFIEARNSAISLDASIFNQTSINLILTFIYTGNLSSSSKPLTLETCEWVWIGADFLNIKNLCEECIYRIATKVHFFKCTCGECQIVVPRVAAFAKEHDVDKLWQGCLHALSQGFDSMWPNKEFANLDEDTREEILMILLASIQRNNVISTFKGCRNIISVIDIKGIGLPWIETVRRMTNEVRSYAAKILVDNFEQLCDEDQEFLNCVDGVGFSSDILEDIMNIIVEESLTEQNSARILKCITGKLLPRPAVSSAENVEAKRLLMQSKQNVFNYMKKRWLGVKQYGGFRLLSPMLLDEFVKELNVDRNELQSLVDSKQVPTQVQPPKPKTRTPSATNGLSKKGLVSPPPKVTVTTASAESTENATSQTTKPIPEIVTPNDTKSSAESSSKGNETTKTTRTVTKKVKNVRIVGDTPVWDRPTRASVLRQKALAESSAKNPVKPRIKSTSTPKSASAGSTSTTKTTKTTTSATTNNKTDRTLRNSSSSSNLRVPKTSSVTQRGRTTTKQATSTASSRTSSISSAKSVNSPSVSPSRFNGVRQTRASMLRQMKYDDVQQRRGRERERDITPKSSRASSIASTSSVTTTSSSHHKRNRSPSVISSISATSSSNGIITSLQPKPHQLKLATNPSADISVGRRIILPTKNNAPGCIQFLGETDFAKGIWVGVELDNPVGKNNGVVASRKYFTAEPDHGIFVRPDSLLLI